MPTYDYHCDTCKKTFEISHKISSEPVASCPECASTNFRRGIGGSSLTFQFKGSGFYVNDYGSAQMSSHCGCGKTSCDK